MEREKCLEILKENVFNENLIKHCIAVEAIMGGLAEHFKEDVLKWKLAGLLHDVDYEKTKELPERHGLESIEILKEYMVEEDILDAIKGHNEMLGFERNTMIAKALFCADQLSGLIVASTLVLPSKKISDLNTDSILRKFKEKSFAKGAKRENILLCETDLNLKLEDFVSLALKAMQEVNKDIGL